MKKNGNKNEIDKTESQLNRHSLMEGSIKNIENMDEIMKKWEEWSVDDCARWIQFILHKNNVEKRIIEVFCNEMKQHQISGKLIQLMIMKIDETMFEQFKSTFEIEFDRFLR